MNRRSFFGCLAMLAIAPRELLTRSSRTTVTHYYWDINNQRWYNAETGAIVRLADPIPSNLCEWHFADSSTIKAARNRLRYYEDLP